MRLLDLAPRGRARKLTIWATALIAVYALAGFFAFPPLLRSILTRKLAAVLHRPVSIERVRVNPFVLSISVSGLSVKDRDGGDFLSLAELYANLQASSLLRRGPVVRQVILRSPHLRIVRNEDLTYNFSDLLAPTPAAQAGSRPLRYSLNNIMVEGGSLDFDDRPKRAVHTVRDLYLGIPFLSNLPYETEIFVEPAFRATVNGSRFALDGKTKPFSDSRETSVEIDVRDIDLPAYLAYLPNPTSAKLLAGHVAAHLGLAFTQYRAKPSTLVLSGRLSFTAIEVGDQAGRPLLALPVLDVSIGAADVLAGNVGLKSVLLQRPRIEVRRDEAGVWNLAALMPSQSGAEPAGGAQGKGTSATIEVGEARLEDGEARFVDASRPAPFEATLRPINASMSHFSTAAGKSAAIELTLASDAGEALKYSGDFTFLPMAASGSATLTGVPVKRYAPYYRDTVGFDVEGGMLAASGRYTWGDGGTVLTGLALSLDSLRLRLRGAKDDFLSVPAVMVKDTSADSAKREVVVGELAVNRGTVKAARAKDGSWDLQQLLPVSPPEAAAVAAPGQRADLRPWQTTVRKLALTDLAVAIEDQVPPRPVTTLLEPFNLTAEGLSTAPGATGKATLRCSINHSGTLSLAGSVGLDPVTAKLAVELKDLGVVPLQPYLEQWARLVVNDGAASASGEITVGATSQGTFATRFSGWASLDRLATVDADSAEDFLKWDSLSLTGIEMVTEPASLRIGDAKLAGCYSRLVVNADGTLNVKKIMAGGEPPADQGSAAPVPAAAATEPAAATSIGIERVTFQDGAISLLDRSMTPAFAAEITHVAGTIAGLSSMATSAADLDLHATLGGGAPIELKGKINPLAGDLFLDITAGCKGIEMTTLSPYSGKYAGYGIEKGKLSLDLKYQLAKRKLESQNKLFLDQFDFGEKVASPTATKLPVRLAVSLLKDREGRINLDLPVSGSLDDPKFRVGRIILKMIENLLLKVATSPFALLGSLFGGGGGASLEHVEFDSGSAALDPAATATLDKLAKALEARPALKLEARGMVDPVRDKDGLVQRAFERKLKVEKLNELVRKGESAGSLDAVTIDQTEYPKYLALAYKHDKLPDKPKNFLGIAKEIPAADMERLMRSHIEVGDDDLRQLAAARAAAVQDYLVQAGKVGAERVFVVENKGVSPAGANAEKLSRVDFALK